MGVSMSRTTSTPLHSHASPSPPYGWLRVIWLQPTALSEYLSDTAGDDPGTGVRRGGSYVRSDTTGRHALIIVSDLPGNKWSSVLHGTKGFRQTRGYFIRRLESRTIRETLSSLVTPVVVKVTAVCGFSCLLSLCTAVLFVIIRITK